MAHPFVQHHQQRPCEDAGMRRIRKLLALSIPDTETRCVPLKHKVLDT